MDASVRRKVRERASNRCEYCRLPQLIPLYHPREQSWEEHFHFVGARIEGLTSTGKATVRLLKMNDEDQTEIRAALMSRGEF